MSVENQTRESAWRMPTPQEKDLEAILVASNPWSELNQVTQKIPFFLPYEQAARLRQEVGCAGTRQEALFSLTWYCLPQLEDAVGTTRRMGIDDQELIQRGLMSLQEIILNWQPKEENPAKQDYLRFLAAETLEKQMAGWVSEEYGLSRARFPMIKLYFDSIREFEEVCGREACEEDFKEILKIVNRQVGELSEEKREQMMKLRLVKVNAGDTRLVRDVLELVHQTYFAKDLEPVVEVSEETKLESASPVCLKEVLGTILPELPEREAEVVRCRFGLDREPQTLEDLGKRFKISREYVRAIEAKALRRLRQPSRSRKLRDFLDR